MTARLLLVEDEAHLAEIVSDNLRMEGWTVDVVGDGIAALTSVRGARPDLVLLDVMLPGKDGFTVCDELRAEGNDVPILFLTARGDRDDRVHGLEVGGDDYLTKPFDLTELILRVKAILRRADWAGSQTDPPGDELVLGDARIDFKRTQVVRDGRDLDLSPKEVLILRCLAERPGEVVTRAQIVERVWGYDAFPTLRTVDNFIVRLRRLIEPDPKAPRYIHTVRGSGYRLTP